MSAYPRYARPVADNRAFVMAGPGSKGMLAKANLAGLKNARGLKRCANGIEITRKESE